MTKSYQVENENLSNKLRALEEQNASVIAQFDESKKSNVELVSFPACIYLIYF